MNTYLMTVKAEIEMKVEAEAPDEHAAKEKLWEEGWDHFKPILVEYGWDAIDDIQLADIKKIEELKDEDQQP
jgi:hypothetical protein